MLDSRKRIGGFHAAPEAPGRMAPVDTRLGGCSPGCPGERAGREHGWVGPAGSGSLFLAALTQVLSWAAAAGAAIWWRHQEAPGGGLEALGRGPPQLARVGGGVDARPRPAPPQPHLGCCSVFAPPDVAPTAQDAASPASASVIRTRALLCCPGSMPGCSGSGEARGPDEPPPRPPEPCMGATDGGGQALPAPAFRRHLLRTYCAPGDAVLALAGLPSQRGPAQGREVTLEAPQVRAGVREGDGQKQSSVGAGGTRRLCRCAGW